ncbi:hypothetical protein DBR33_02770 [Stenotrophomonas sp. HMWF022]|uniref:hypothetical protein n=1 Tax=Stenotrophomonas sp. HMWF023 TaxID=2056859 RepID=UPI000D362F22|nr:hypothetical protein [Stenotrophomonas sp. HMWF023]PTS77741.1 hypothetical protein DBR20_07415 [Stenotrophomonas sp. HMWF023]PTT56138.1 hypothetical protein DBR33_02770 [Stenotrophomonas sp. HMWF022]
MSLFDSMRRRKVPPSHEHVMGLQAEAFIASFQEEGARINPAHLDYTRESLALVDSALDDFFVQERPLSEELHFLYSAYVFEVARRAYGGRYQRGDQKNPFVLVIGEPDFRAGVLVMEKVSGRVVNGPEDDLRSSMMASKRCWKGARMPL